MKSRRITKCHICASVDTVLRATLIIPASETLKVANFDSFDNSRFRTNC
jgi:hypothetical protein